MIRRFNYIFTGTPGGGRADVWGHGRRVARGAQHVGETRSGRRSGRPSRRSARYISLACPRANGNPGDKRHRDGITRETASSGRSMSHFQRRARGVVASGAVATPCAAFIDRARDAQTWIGKGYGRPTIKHPRNSPSLPVPFIATHPAALLREHYHFLPLIAPR